MLETRIKGKRGNKSNELSNKQKLNNNNLHIKEESRSKNSADENRIATEKGVVNKSSESSLLIVKLKTKSVKLV